MSCDLNNYKVIFRNFSKVFICLVVLIVSINYGYSQNMPVPENIQAALLPKVLKFNTNFAEKKTIRMLIVYDNNSRLNKDKFIKELRGTIEITAILENEIESSIANCDLVYFMPGIEDKYEICKRYKVLSVTGISQYVEKGDMSLAFGIQNNKPKIFVNLTSLEREGQNLSSDILRIAKIYQ